LFDFAAKDVGGFTSTPPGRIAFASRWTENVYVQAGGGKTTSSAAQAMKTSPAARPRLDRRRRGNDQLRGNGSPTSSSAAMERRNHRRRGKDLFGENGNDTINGPKADLLLGGAGEDHLRGNAGNDVIDGQAAPI
jgi:Ca2+-binding RTX toxin-like protein